VKFIEEHLQPAVAALSERSIAIVLGSIYGGVGLILPALLDVSLPVFIAFNAIAVGVAGFLGLLWLAGVVRDSHRRLLVEWTSNLRTLDGAEFEWLVGEVFRREGWNIQETGRQDAPDGNVDLVLTRQGRRVLVQCKRWQARQVGVDEIRSFAGTLRGRDVGRGDGCFVTLSRFTSPAREEAKAQGIELVNGVDLYERMERVRRKEPCPVCGAPLVLNRSMHGWWLRCVADGCRGKRDLSADPARAIDFLLKRP
jgi:hypothetical protein